MIKARNNKEKGRITRKLGQQKRKMVKITVVTMKTAVYNVCIRKTLYLYCNAKTQYSIILSVFKQFLNEFTLDRKIMNKNYSKYNSFSNCHFITCSLLILAELQPQEYRRIFRKNISKRIMLPIVILKMFQFCHRKSYNESECQPKTQFKIISYLFQYQNRTISKGIIGNIMIFGIFCMDFSSMFFRFYLK